MKVALYNLEPEIKNTAMMRCSRWHKDQGDEVERYIPYKGYRYYDRIYVFSLFDFTEKKNIPPNAICGGTGFDIFIKLQKEIEYADYDWSLYPECDYSLIWFSTGCIYDREKHPYCIVVDKEGFIETVKPKNLNPNGTCPECKKITSEGNPMCLDHIIPISKAPKGMVYKIDDVQPLCRQCNSSKGDKI